MMKEGTLRMGKSRDLACGRPMSLPKEGHRLYAGDTVQKDPEFSTLDHASQGIQAVAQPCFETDEGSVFSGSL